MTPMTCVVIGNESLLVQCCEKLLESGHAIAAVVTRNPEIALWAQGRDLRSVAPGPGLARRLPDAPFDWLLSIANLDILPADVLSRPVRGAVNFHDGPLPRHAGLNAPLWALIEGETRHGITWHMISGGVDEGDVLTRRGFDIADTDTALTLNAKCFEAAIDSFGELIDQLETGNPQRCPQDPSQRRLHALADRPAHGGCLDFTRPARELERLVRALDHGRYWNPLCTAKFWIDGRFWHVGAAQTGTEIGAPGTVLAVTSDRLTLACGTGSLILSDLRHRDGTPADPAQV
ncbi:formyltransferase family protein, partial [Puniceibacterium confluentis]|uniref:formyltransferase family protein n=1 Tax=Puniceibacterium confluentis TaxID=1958944 RepID=UPI003564AAB5